jgi:hypothetical protein
MSVNIANEYFKNQKKNLTDYLTLIMDTKSNNSVSKVLIESYMEARFYNYADDDSMKNMINTYLKDEIREVDKNDKEIANIYVDILNQMFYLDTFSDDAVIKNRINTINNYRVQKLGINEKGFVEKFMKIIKFNNTKRDKYLKNISSNDFSLIINKTKINKVYDISIKHHIMFNKLYSDFAINNAFDTGMVKEDKMSVIYYLYSSIVMQNIIRGDFSNNYLVPFDTDLFLKKKKLGSTLNILDSDPVKDMTSFKITFTEFESYKNDIYELKREGYNFAVIIDSSYKEDIVNFTQLQAFKYVIINNEEYKYSSLLKKDNVICM